MGHAPQLVPDATLLIQMALFVASYFVMKSLVFRPYLSLLHARQAKTTGLKEKAQADRAQAEGLRAKYEAFIKAERKRISDRVEAERHKVADEERTILQNTRTEVGKELEGLRTSIRSDYDRARRELLPLVSEYSSQIASKLVGRKVTVSAISSDFKAAGETEYTALS